MHTETYPAETRLLSANLL